MAEVPEDFDPSKPAVHNMKWLMEADQHRRNELDHLNLSGAIEQEATYTALTDACMVEQASQPNDGVVRNEAVGAMAELNRRHTEALRQHARAMEKSSSAAYTRPRALFESSAGAYFNDREPASQRD